MRSCGTERSEPTDVLSTNVFSIEQYPGIALGIGYCNTQYPIPIPKNFERRVSQCAIPTQYPGYWPLLDGKAPTQEREREKLRPQSTETTMLLKCTRFFSLYLVNFIKTSKTYHIKNVSVSVSYNVSKNGNVFRYIWRRYLGILNL